MAAAIPLAIGAVAGGISAEEEKRDARRFNRAAAEANRYADVTGHRTQMRREGPGFFGGAIKGAGTFAPLMGAFGGAPAAAPQKVTGMQTGGMTGRFDALNPQQNTPFGTIA